MKKKLLLGMAVMSAAMALSGCGTDTANNANRADGTEKEETEERISEKETPEEETPEEETRQETEKEEITVQELSIQNGENTIYGKLYIPAGEGKHPAIILCHGYNGTNNDFVKECSYYAENGYIAYAFDFCGGSVNSKSSGKSTDMTIFTEKSDLLAVFDYIELMENVDAEQIFLFGGSQGGLVTTLATEERAEKVKGMILYFPALNIPDDWRKTYPDVEDIPETLSFWGLTLGKNFFLDMHDFYTFDNIGSYDGDVLILHGDKDNIAPISGSIEAQKKYPHAELITMPGEGHGFSPSGANTAEQKVLEFLQAHTEKRADE